MRRFWPNKITGANAGGPRRLPMRTRWAARVAQFGRWADMLDLADTTFRAYRKKSGLITLHLRTFLLIRAEVGFSLAAYLRKLCFSIHLPGFKESIECTHDLWYAATFRTSEPLMAHDLWVSAVVGRREVPQCIATLRMDYHLSFTGHFAEESATWIRKVVVVPRYPRAR